MTASSIPTPRSSPQAHETVRILLVEDDPEAARFYRALFGGWSGTCFAVCHRTSLSEALETLCWATFDAIVLDLGLPDARAQETLAQASLLARSVPIVALTAEDDPQFAQRALRYGLGEYLVKGRTRPRDVVEATLRCVASQDDGPARSR